MSLSEVSRRNIRAEMARAGVTQDVLAGVLGFSRQALSHRLLGNIEFRISELEQIAEFLNVAVGTLLAPAASASEKETV